jgi:hypothetical protein
MKSRLQTKDSMTAQSDQPVSLIDIAPLDLRRLIGFLRRGADPASGSPEVRDAGLGRLRGIVREAFGETRDQAGADAWDKALYDRVHAALVAAGATELHVDAMAYAFVSFIVERRAPQPEEREHQLAMVTRYLALDVTMPIRPGDGRVELPDTKH